MLDVWGLAGGGIILGGVQAGFELVGRKSHGYGDDSVEANRHMLGTGWESETVKEGTWTPAERIAYIGGVPPCSGFSLLNTAGSMAKKRGKEPTPNTRGMTAAINSCQLELIRYAGTCTGSDGGRGPEFVVFESVGGAFTKGLPLMRHYWDELNRVTGQRYELTHLMHNLATLGGAQIRARYLWVAHRIPFGVELELPKRITTVQDAIGDLVGLKLGPSEQPTNGEASAYAKPLLRPDRKVDYHVTMTNQKHLEVIEQMCSVGWEPGMNHEAIIKKALVVDPTLSGIQRWWRNDKVRGFMGPRRLRWDRPSFVLTGGGPYDFVHPSENRLLSIREIARLMGVPDAWRLDYHKRPEISGAHLGKNCSAMVGKWVATWIKRSLEGQPGKVTDRQQKWDKLALMPGEHVVDFNNDYRAILKKQLGTADLEG